MATPHRVALLGPPPGIDAFRRRKLEPNIKLVGHKVAEREVEVRAYKRVLTRLQRKPGETMAITIKLGKRFKYRDLSDPFVRRMVYLEASMIAHNRVLDGAVKDHNYGVAYTNTIDHFVENYVPTEKQEAVWRLVRKDHEQVLKRPKIIFKGPPRNLYEWRTKTPDRIRHDEARPQNQTRLVESAQEVMGMADISREQRLATAYASAAQLADMKRNEPMRPGERFDWGRAYTNGLLTILEATPANEKYILLKTAFDDHLAEGTATVARRKG